MSFDLSCNDRYEIGKEFCEMLAVSKPALAEDLAFNGPKCHLHHDGTGGPCFMVFTDYEPSLAAMDELDFMAGEFDGPGITLPALPDVLISLYQSKKGMPPVLDDHILVPGYVFSGLGVAGMRPGSWYSCPLRAMEAHSYAMETPDGKKFSVPHDMLSDIKKLMG